MRNFERIGRFVFLGPIGLGFLFFGLNGLLGVFNGGYFLDTKIFLYPPSSINVILLFVIAAAYVAIGSLIMLMIFRPKLK